MPFMQSTLDFSDPRSRLPKVSFLSPAPFSPALPFCRHSFSPFRAVPCRAVPCRAVPCSAVRCPPTACRPCSRSLSFSPLAPAGSRRSLSCHVNTMHYMTPPCARRDTHGWRRMMPWFLFCFALSTPINPPCRLPRVVLFWRCFCPPCFVLRGGVPTRPAGCVALPRCFRRVGVASLPPLVGSATCPSR